MNQIIVPITALAIILIWMYLYSNYKKNYYKSIQENETKAALIRGMFAELRHLHEVRREVEYSAFSSQIMDGIDARIFELEIKLGIDGSGERDF